MKHKMILMSREIPDGNWCAEGEHELEPEAAHDELRELVLHRSEGVEFAFFTPFTSIVQVKKVVQVSDGPAKGELYG